MPVKKTTANKKVSRRPAAATKSVQADEATTAEVAEPEHAKRRSLPSIRHLEGVAKRLPRLSRLRLRRNKPAEERPVYQKMPHAHRLFIQAVKVPLQHWEVFVGVLIIYGFLNVLVVGGITSIGDLSSIKQNIAQGINGHFGGKLNIGITLFGVLATDRANTAASGAAGAYSSLLLLITSLAIIWGLRQVYAGHIIRIRDTFYNGMQPLIQSVLTIFIVGLQILPAALGGQLLNILISGGILIGPVEIGVATCIFALLLFWSVYMLCSSLFALYIVTLPNMTPLQAIRSARSIVQYRRGKVLVKLLALPLGLLIIAGIIMVPISLLITPIAPVMFYVLTVIALVIMHSYMYALYRELIAG